MYSIIPEILEDGTEYYPDGQFDEERSRNREEGDI